MDRYTVTVNDETVVDTDKFAHAAAAYTRCCEANSKGSIVEISQYDWSNEKLVLKLIRRCVI